MESVYIGRYREYNRCGVISVREVIRACMCVCVCVCKLYVDGVICAEPPAASLLAKQTIPRHNENAMVCAF